MENPPDDEAELKKYYDLYLEKEFVDDLTGVPLDRDMAIQARKLEMDYFKKMKVYSKIPRRAGMKVITTRWIDTNKRDSPNQTLDQGWVVVS